MSDIPSFAKAVSEFHRFLVRNGHPTDLFWVFREDLWKRSPTDVWVRYPPAAENASLAERVFSEGREKGLVEIKAVALAADKVAASVWFPSAPGEEVQGAERGLRFSIANPLPHAKTLGLLRWFLLCLRPRFRHYQTADIFMGTKAWAATLDKRRGKDT